MKTNKEIAELFEDIAFLLEIKGEEKFKINSYIKAALSIKRLPYPLYKYAEEGKLREIKGVGEAIEKKIKEAISTGEIGLRKRLLSEFPETLLELKKIPGIGAKTAKKLYFDANVKSIVDLKEFIKDPRAIKFFKSKYQKIKEYLEGK